MANQRDTLHIAWVERGIRLKLKHRLQLKLTKAKAPYLL